MPTTHTVDGAKLRARRRDRGLSVAVVARAVARTPDLIYSVEQGRTQPSAEVLDTLCRLLDVTPTDLTPDDTEGAAA